MLYSLLSGGAPGEPQELPVSFSNVSGFNLLSAAEVTDYGWYPVIDEAPVPEPGHFVQVSGLLFDPKRQAVVRRYEQVALPTPTLQAAKEAKLEEINKAYSAFMEPVSKSYPEVERLGWAQQLDEATQYLTWVAAGEKGKAPVTPVLDRILEGRNADGGEETLEVLASKVQINAEILIETQVYTGHRQRLEKLVEKAASVEEVQAINPQVVFTTNLAHKASTA